MEARSLTKNDYKKWLSYSFDSTDHQKLFNLYKALDSQSDSGVVTFKKAIYQDGVSIHISCETANDDLLIDENVRIEFKKYLTENYFRTDNVERWYLEKVDGIEKQKNFSTMPAAEQYAENGTRVVKPHPKEISYLNIRIVITALFYLVFAVAIIAAFSADVMLGVAFFLVIPFFLLLSLVNTFFKGLFTGIIKGNAIQLTPNQFPEIYQIVKEESRKLNIPEPEVYIAEGPFNAFAMSFARAKIVVLFSTVIETAMTGDYDVVRFVVAHELCHLKRKHSMKEKLLFPSSIIPFLYRAYSRGCEYTCDRAGYLASPKGAIEGVLIMTTGKEIYSRFNVEQHIKTATASANFWTWASEKFLTHPHLYKRLTAIKQFSEYNY